MSDNLSDSNPWAEIDKLIENLEASTQQPASPFTNQLKQKRLDVLSKIVEQERATVIQSLGELITHDQNIITVGTYQYDEDSDYLPIVDRENSIKHLDNLEHMRMQASHLYNTHGSFPTLEFSDDKLFVTLETVCHEVTLTEDGITSSALSKALKAFEAQVSHAKLQGDLSRQLWEQELLLDGLVREVEKTEASLANFEGANLEGAKAYMMSMTDELNALYTDFSSGSEDLAQEARNRILASAQEAQQGSMEFSVHAIILSYLTEHTTTPESREQKIEAVRAIRIQERFGNAPAIDFDELEREYNDDLNAIFNAMRLEQGITLGDKEPENDFEQLLSSAMSSVESGSEFKQHSARKELAEAGKRAAEKNPFALAAAKLGIQEELNSGEPEQKVEKEEPKSNVIKVKFGR